MMIWTIELPSLSLIAPNGSRTNSVIFLYFEYLNLTARVPTDSQMLNNSSYWSIFNCLDIKDINPLFSKRIIFQFGWQCFY